jgi:hypothetical protein
VKVGNGASRRRAEPQVCSRRVAEVWSEKDRQGCPAACSGKRALLCSLRIDVAQTKSFGNPREPGQKRSFGPLLPTERVPV